MTQRGPDRRRITRGSALEWTSHRDPVCGMAVEATAELAALDGLTLRFCSEQCHSKFNATPARYLPAIRALDPTLTGAPHE